MIGEDDFVNVSSINQYRSPQNCTECDMGSDGRKI